MSKKLFDGSDESDGDELQLGTNKEYAKSYNNFRKKELVKKFKDRGYDVSESGSSSDSESSSEEDDVLDAKFDQEFFKTLSCLKSKDPAIYDKGTHFFKGLEHDAENQDKKTKKAKPVTLKDYERQIILENGGKFEDDSGEETDNRAASPTLAEEERHLKEEFKKVVNDSDASADDEEDAFGGIFKKREKTKEEQDKEDVDYLKWLAGQKEDVDPTVKEKLKPLKNYWSNEKLPQSERFLRDYILNKGYANAKSSEIPTYDEIVGDNEPLSEDEKELEKQAEFEHKYNFRYEEPDAEFVKRYPRTIENSVRRTDDRRKQKRQDVKERKEQEKVQKMKELEIVKEMKRKEIEEKIRKLKLVTGNEQLGFKDEELEDDFDPEAHDRRMRELFNDDYYQVDEGEEKPECPSDIDELKVEDWDNFDPAAEDDADDYEPHCEDDEFNMDCDYDPALAKEKLQQELIENTKKRKGRKGRKSQFMEVIKAEKPVFNPEDAKTYEEYIDEYYKLDCEDVIGDIPCRFKYVETTPNDFGLTIEEILLAKNKELNQWASLKKTIQIRPDHIEKKDQRLYKLKAKNDALKRKIFKSLYDDGSGDEDTADDKPGSVNEMEATPTEAASKEQSGNTEAVKKSKKKRKRKAQATQQTDNNVAATAAAETEVAAKKHKEEETKTINPATAQVVKTPSETAETATAAAQSKKKRKKRKNKAAANAAPNTTNSTTANANDNDATVKNTTPSGDSKPAQQNKSNPFNGPKKQFPSGMQKPVTQRGKWNTFNGAKKSGPHNKSNHFNAAKRALPNGDQKPMQQNNKSNPFAGTKNATANDAPKTTPNAASKSAPNEASKSAPQHKSNPFKNAQTGNVKRIDMPQKRNNAVKNDKGKFKAKFRNFNNKNSNSKGASGDSKISDERLKAYGINPKKFHKKQKYGKAQTTSN